MKKLLKSVDAYPHFKKLSFIIRLRVLLLLVAVLFFSTTVYAGDKTDLSGEAKIAQQQQTVTGKVTDGNQEPLPGVTIVLKGTTQGTITDINGEYTLTGVAPGGILVFSFVGMRTQEIAVENRLVINVILEEETIGIEEVVAIGYGVQKKENLTGAVSHVSAEVLENRPIVNVGQGLQGTIPGLTITQSYGDPGRGSSFNIRGVTSISGGSPLILVDGVPKDINLINPNDIADVSVLKDASSAAIYGARAAFGVILITTKQGKASKPTISLNSNYAVNTPLNKYSQMDSYQRMVFMDEAQIRESGRPYHDDIIRDALTAHYFDPSKPYWVHHPSNPPDMYSWVANTDWPNEILLNNFPMHQHAISVSGGTDKLDYYTSLGYLDQRGITRHFNEKYHRYNLTSNINYVVTDWLKIGNSLSANISDKKFPPNSRTGITPESNAPTHTYNWPHCPVYDPHGQWAQSTNMVGGTSGVPNMVFLHKEGGSQSRDIIDLWMSGKAILTPVKNTVFNFEYSYNINKNDYFDHGRELWGSIGVPGYPLGPSGATLPSTVRRQHNEYRQSVLNAYGNYENTFSDKHYFNVMLGFSQEGLHNRGHSLSREDLMVQSIPFLKLATGAMLVGDSESEYNLRSGFGRINYIYDNRYYFETNARYDGTSRFPKDDRFDIFPSFSLGWRIENEPWLESLKNIFDMLKVRASYGSLGNQVVSGYYPYIPTYSSGQVSYLLGGSLPMSVYAPGLVSPTLTWETVNQRNIGLDISVLNHRLNATVDVYRRDTKNMLMASELKPSILGVAEPQENAADLKTTGWDLEVNWRDRTHAFNYEVTLTLSDYQGEITRYDNPAGLISQHYVGKKWGEIWGLVTDGFFRSDEEASNANHTNIVSRKLLEGDLKFKDLDGDNKITRGANTLDNPGDQKIIGNSQPRYLFGLRSYIGWKGFDLDLFFQGVGKKDTWIGATNFLEHYTSQWNTGPGIATDYWSPDNPNAYFPRPTITNAADVTAVQTHFLQDASYIRLKQLTIGYNLPKDLIKQASIERIRIYFSGQNLLTFTNMIKLVDPEQSNTRHYPLNRVASIGVNIEF